MFLKLKDWVFNLDHVNAVTVYGKTTYVYCTNDDSPYEICYESEEESRDVFQKMLKFLDSIKPRE